MDVVSDVVDDDVVFFIEIDLYPSHLTQRDYEISQLSIQFDDEVKEEEIFQSQPQKKYDLRPRPEASKETTPSQKKRSDLPLKQGRSKGTSNKTDQPLPSKPVAPKVKEA
jgi:hypothetical protein